MPGHATVPERDLDPGFGESRLTDVPNRPVDPILANLLADQGSLGAYDGVTSMWYTTNSDPVMTVFSWQPDRDDVQNMQVLDRMTDLAFEFTLTVRGERTVVGFSREPVTRSEDRDRSGWLLRAALAAAKSPVD